MRLLKQIAPGFYYDPERRELYAHIPELLALAGWENTPAKFDEMADIVKEVAPQMLPDIPLIIVAKMELLGTRIIQ